MIMIGVTINIITTANPIALNILLLNKTAKEKFRKKFIISINKQLRIYY